jgi:osmoprotectant transport system substrate-binding protein
VTLRKDFDAAHPQVRQVMEPILKKLDNKTMQKLNAEVDVDGRDPAVVARDWLAGEGFVGS